MAHVTDQLDSFPTVSEHEKGRGSSDRITRAVADATFGSPSLYGLGADDWAAMDAYQIVSFPYCAGYPDEALYESNRETVRAEIEGWIGDEDDSEAIIIVDGPEYGLSVAYRRDANEDALTAMVECLNALEAHCILDEGDWSERQMVAANEEWAEWGASDYWRAAVREHDLSERAADLLSDHESDAFVAMEHMVRSGGWRVVTGFRPAWQKPTARAIGPIQRYDREPLDRKPPTARAIGPIQHSPVLAGELFIDISEDCYSYRTPTRGEIAYALWAARKLESGAKLLDIIVG